MTQTLWKTPSVRESPATQPLTAAAPLLSMRQLTVGLVAIMLLASAPFLMAVVLRATRASRARADVERIAAALRGLPEPVGQGALIGRGKLPAGASNSPWLHASPESLDQELMRRGVPDARTTDPWLAPYLVNVGAARFRWVISAGPNGILETPFEGASAPQGDDLAALVQ